MRSHARMPFLLTIYLLLNYLPTVLPPRRELCRSFSDPRALAYGCCTCSSAEEKAAEEEAAAKAAAKAEAKKKAAQVKVAAVSKGNNLIGFASGSCGNSGATNDEPNGSQDWLNCGISKSSPDSGWNPPVIKINQLKTVSLEEAIASNSVWEPCRQFIKLFEKIGAQTDLPPILLASFALQVRRYACLNRSAELTPRSFAGIDLQPQRCRRWRRGWTDADHRGTHVCLLVLS